MLPFALPPPATFTASTGKLGRIITSIYSCQHAPQPHRFGGKRGYLTIHGLAHTTLQVHAYHGGLVYLCPDIGYTGGLGVGGKLALTAPQSICSPTTPVVRALPWS